MGERKTGKAEDKEDENGRSTGGNTYIMKVNSVIVFLLNNFVDLSRLNSIRGGRKVQLKLKRRLQNQRSSRDLPLAEGSTIYF